MAAGCNLGDTLSVVKRIASFAAVCAASVLLIPAHLYGQAPATALTVEQAVETALTDNLDLMAERQNVPISKAREIQAALRPNPVLTVGVDYQDWLGISGTFFDASGPPEWNAKFDWILEGGGKRRRRIDVAKLATSVSELRLLDAMRQLSLNVHIACADYLLAKENLGLAQSNLKVFNDILQVNEARVKAGDLAGVELIRTRVAQQQVQNSVQQAELRLKTAANNLQQLIGRKGKGELFDVSGPLNEAPVVILPDELKQEALSRRPDLLAARKDIDRSKADTQLQIANWKPDYTVSFLYHDQYTIPNASTFGVYLQMPLPFRNRNQGEIARSQRETQQAGIRAQALEMSIATEVENAYQQYLTARGLLERIRGSLLYEAKQVRDITEFSYRRGEASLLEFLDAQRAYNDAQQSYNDARADYTKSLFLIDSVTGKSVNP